MGMGPTGSKLLDNVSRFEYVLNFVDDQQLANRSQGLEVFHFCRRLNVDLTTLQILYVCKVDDLITFPKGLGRLPEGLSSKDICMIAHASD
jgi:hypothetical protein